MPGRNDMRPGVSWTVTLPPGGVLVTAVCGALMVGGMALDGLGAAYGGEDGGAWTYAFLDTLGGEPAPEGAFCQGMTFGGASALFEAVSFDLYFTGSSALDLSTGRSVRTYGLGLDFAFFIGAGRGGKVRFLTGYEYRRVDFQGRPDGDGYGPMVGVGLEIDGGGGTSLAAQFRYVFTSGSVGEYDFWDVGIGAGFYW